MSPSSRRASLVAVLGALALAVPGLPAAPAEAASSVPAAVVAGAPKTTRIAGITQVAFKEDRTVLDTRMTGSKAPLGARATRTVDLEAEMEVPGDATAAILSVTSVAATRAGWLTVWRADRSRPAASSLNFGPGAPVSNLAVVRLGVGRKISLHNGSDGTTHVVLSVRGWIRANRGAVRPGTLTPIDPTRVADTRTAATPIPARGYRDIKVAGAAVPASAASALLDVIAVKPTKAGYLTAHPSDSARPASTALTFRVGEDRAVLSLFRLSATGTVRLWNMSSAPVHVVLDAFAWATGGDTSRIPMGTRALTPERILDTRTSGGPIDSQTGWTREIPLPSEDPARGLGTPSAVVLSVTTTGATQAGTLRIVTPFVSNSGDLIEFRAGETTTATTYVVAPSGHRLEAAVARPWSGKVHVIVDIVGVVNHEWQVDGRVVEEITRTPIHPAAVGDDFRFQNYSVVTAPGGSFIARGNGSTLPRVCAAPVDALGTSEDLHYVPACIGGNKSPTPIRRAAGSVTTVGDVPVPRAGSMSGTIVDPDGRPSLPRGLIVQRADGRFEELFGSSSDGSWTRPRLPVGEWIVVVYSFSDGMGEVMNDLPTPTTSGWLTELLAAGATRFRVAPDDNTHVGRVQLKTPGYIKWLVADPDGDYADVTVTIHHESGIPIYSVFNNSTYTASLRPGAYTICASEAGVTTCNGGAASHEEATPIVVEADTTVEIPLALP